MSFWSIYFNFKHACVYFINSHQSSVIYHPKLTRCYSLLLLVVYFLLPLLFHTVHYKSSEEFVHWIAIAVLRKHEKRLTPERLSVFFPLFSSPKLKYAFAIGSFEEIWKTELKNKHTLLIELESIKTYLCVLLEKVYKRKTWKDGMREFKCFHFSCRSHSPPPLLSVRVQSALNNFSTKNT